jgi:uncharacterized protein YciI
MRIAVMFAILFSCLLLNPVFCANAGEPASDVRFVVFHTQGPKFDQRTKLPPNESIPGHLQHYKKLLDQHKLSMGGPFPKKRGGMMICSPGVKREDIEKFASEDPAVKSGVLKAEVAEWHIALKQPSK